MELITTEKGFIALALVDNFTETYAFVIYRIA